MAGGGCNVALDESKPLGGLVHVETKTTPLFLHTPGKFLDCLAHLTDTLEISAPEPERRRALQSSAIPPCNYGICPPRPNDCPYIQCNFTDLAADIPMTNSAQKSQLYKSCGIKKVSAREGNEGRTLIIFDSTKERGTLTKDDPDLGAPNRACPGGGPGKGPGGLPTAAFPNCSPQDNLLIIQDPRKPIRNHGANDSPFGGCIWFEFESPIDLIDMGIMDLEETATITMVTVGGGGAGPFTSPPGVGDNGFWPMSVTYPTVSYQAVGVTKMKICLKGSGGISYLNYHDCKPNPTTSAPTKSPVASPTPPPTSAPTLSPTDAPTQYPTSVAPTPSPPSCEVVDCNFSTLWVGTSLKNSTQAARLRDTCHMTVKATNTINNNDVNIFDSTNIKGTKSKHDPDLGAPNSRCPGGGPGRGNGGWPNAPFPNCDPQGNLMIIQNENKPASNPNDSAYGGCLNFEFTETVSMIDLVLLDIDDGDAATVTFNGNTSPDITSPLNIGDNGLWPVSKTDPQVGDYAAVDKMRFASPGPVPFRPSSSRYAIKNKFSFFWFIGMTSGEFELPFR
jgi:hypothetical protein